jgi:ERCC4-type nuclease
MSWNIVVDCGETDLIKQLTGLNAVFATEDLPVGDIAYRLDGVDKCIIERKKIADYSASITDGRLANQSIRLKSLGSQMIVIYLIEESIPHDDYKFPNRISGKSLYSSILGKIVRDHFYVWQTINIKETAVFCQKMLTKLSSDYVSPDAEIELTELDYARTIKTSKKANMTPEMCYRCQLAQIPGVSVDIAETIAGSWSSMSKLIAGFMQSKNPDKMLQECQGIGKVLAQRVYEYLMHEPVQTNNLTDNEVKMKANVKMNVKMNIDHIQPPPSPSGTKIKFGIRLKDTIE